jgi:hypothetical protein
MVNIETEEVKHIRYKDVTAPVLHRKELMVPPYYPHYAMFRRLTEMEEQQTLLVKPPGNKRDWLALLDKHGYTVFGHKLYKEVT